MEKEFLIRIGKAYRDDPRIIYVCTECNKSVKLIDTPPQTCDCGYEMISRGDALGRYVTMLPSDYGRHIKNLLNRMSIEEISAITERSVEWLEACIKCHEELTS